jgi:hypothetical protein
MQLYQRVFGEYLLPGYRNLPDMLNQDLFPDECALLWFQFINKRPELN